MSYNHTSSDFNQGPGHGRYFNLGADAGAETAPVDQNHKLELAALENASAVRRQVALGSEKLKLRSDDARARQAVEQQKADQCAEAMSRAEHDHEYWLRERENREGSQKVFYELEEHHNKTQEHVRDVESETSQIVNMHEFWAFLLMIVVALTEATIQVFGGSLRSETQSAADLALTIGLAGFVLSILAHQIGHSHTLANGEKPRSIDRIISGQVLKIALVAVMIFSLYQTGYLWFFADIPLSLVRFDWAAFMSYLYDLPSVLEDIAIYVIANYILFGIAWLIGAKTCNSRNDLRRLQRAAKRASRAYNKALSRRDDENESRALALRSTLRELESRRNHHAQKALDAGRQAEDEISRLARTREQAVDAFLNQWEQVLSGFAHALAARGEPFDTDRADGLMFTRDEAWAKVCEQRRPIARAVPSSGGFLKGVMGAVLAVFALAVIAPDAARAQSSNWPCSDTRSRIVIVLDESDPRDAQDLHLLDETLSKVRREAGRWQRISVWRMGRTAGASRLVLDSCVPPPCPQAFQDVLRDLNCREVERNPMIEQFNRELAAAFVEYRNNTRRNQPTPMLQTLDRILASYSYDVVAPTLLVLSDGLENSQAVPWARLCICNRANFDRIWQITSDLNLLRPTNGAVVYFVGPGRHMGRNRNGERELSPQQYSATREFWTIWLEARDAHLGGFSSSVPGVSFSQ